MDDSPNSDSPRAFWAGVIFWTLLCLIAIAVRGVRWEEGLERAQVLLNITPYPDGHPHHRWVWNGFSIHYYLTGAVLWLTESATLICGGRQFIATLAIHLPVYGLTWILTRRVFPAHLAALLGFVGANTVFQSYMPILPWATKATSGIIGMGWAFAVLLAFAAGRWRTAGLLFGLMPLVHLGQWPMILLTALATLGWLCYQGERESVKQMLRWAGAGLLCCLVFAVAQRPVLVPDPTEGAYYSDADGQKIWAEYTTHEDMHRALTDWPRFGLMGNSNMALIAVLLLTWPYALRAASGTRRYGPWLLLFTYALLSSAAIWFAQVVHHFTGTDVPYIVVSWMPYRLTIHVSMLLLCITAAHALRRDTQQLSLPAFAALTWLAILPLWPWLLPETWVSRYFSTPETAIFLLIGGTIMHTIADMAPRSLLRRCYVGGLVPGAVALGAYHQMAAATIAAGIGLAIVATWCPRCCTLSRRWQSVSLATLGLMAMGHVLSVEWQTREHLPVSPFEAAMAIYLAEHSAPEDMVLTPLDEHYQMVLQRPVVATFETRQFMSYMQSLATTTDKLFADLYGVRDGHWYDWALWQERSESEWQVLAEAYGFRYVVSKSFHPLHLPERLRGDGLVLYEIPGRANTPPNP